MSLGHDDLRAELESIAAAHGGRLTAEAVLDAASDPTSPLHQQFEWDNDAAARKHRLDQARALIRSVRVVVTTDRRVVSTVYYVRDPEAPANRQGYVSVSQLRGDMEMAREALLAEFARAAVLLQRARDLAAVLGVDGEVMEMINTMDSLRTRIAEPPAAQAVM